MAQSKIVEVSASAELVALHHPEREEEVNFNWKIANFKDVYLAAKSSGTKEIFRFPFTAGKSIGSPSNWELHLQINTKGGLASELKFLGSFPCGATYILYLKKATGEYQFESCNGLLGLFATRYPKPSDSVDEEDLSKPFFKCETLEALQEKGFLSTGELQMKLKFALSIEETLVSATETQLKRDLSWDLKNMLESGVGADVTFNFVEEEGSKNIIAKIKAHRLILTQRSSVFATMFGVGMKEATDGEVEIEDISPKAFGILLQFLYSGELDVEWGSVAVELIYAADKYDLKGLQDYLLENIQSALTVRNVWSIRRMADLYKRPQILKSTMKYIKENMEDVVENVHDVVLKEQKSGA